MLEILEKFAAPEDIKSLREISIALDEARPRTAHRLAVELDASGVTAGPTHSVVRDLAKAISARVLGLHRAAARASRAALTAASPPTPDDLRCIAQLEAGRAELGCGRPVSAKPYIDAALPSADVSGDPVLRCSATIAAAKCALYQGDPAAALDLAESARAIARESGRAGLVLLSDMTEASALRSVGRHADAIQVLAGYEADRADVRNRHAWLQAQLLRGDTMRFCSRAADAEAILLSAIDETDASEAPQLAAQLHTALGNVRVFTSDWDAALAEFESALQFVDQVEAPGALVNAAVGAGQCWLFKGDFVRGQALFDRAVSYASKVEAPYLAVNPLLGLSAILSDSGRWLHAAAAADAGLHAARHAGNHLALADALNVLGRALTQIGAFRRSASLHREALGLGVDLDDEIVQVQSRHALSEAIAGTHEFETALSELESAKPLLPSGSHPSLLGQYHLLRGKLLLHLGRPEEALLDFDESLSLAKSSNMDGVANFIEQNRAEALRDLGRVEEAEEIEQRVLAIARKQRAAPLEANSLVGLAECAELLADFQRAKSLFSEALSLGLQLNYGFARARATAGLRRIRLISEAPKSPRVPADSSPAEIEERERMVAQRYGPAFAKNLPPSEEDRVRVLWDCIPEERRWVAVLSCDIRGFTTAYKATDPDVRNEEADLFLSRATDAIWNAGGAVDKTMGDCVLAYFMAGASTAKGPDQRAELARRALEAGVSIASDPILRAQFLRYADRDSSVDPASFGIGVGVAVGFAECKFVGARERREYTLMGRPVDLASRVQGVARAWETVATLETWQEAEHAQGALRLRPRDRHLDEGHRLKGYESTALVSVEIVPGSPGFPG